MQGIIHKLKMRCEFIKENWEEYMGSTICTDEIEYIVGEKDKSDDVDHEYFVFKPVQRLYSITLRGGK